VAVAVAREAKSERLDIYWQWPVQPENSNVVSVVWPPLGWLNNGLALPARSVKDDGHSLGARLAVAL
jgi:hypothetical protein